MPILAIVNRKGGSGKSTIAAHIASFWARQGVGVMLGDIDRQQSSRTWLGLRPPTVPRILPWAVDNKSILRVPMGVTHVVLDTPGGLHGFDLAKVVMFADIVLIPVSHSIFDLASAGQCIAELKALPKIASGKCRVGVMGMRVEEVTESNMVLAPWAANHGLNYLGAVRKAHHYVNSIEKGLTLFDLPAHEVTEELRDWDPIIGWLDSIILFSKRRSA